MADANPIGETAGRLVGDIGSGFLIAFAVILLLAVTIGIIWFFAVYKRKFDIIIKISSKRAGGKYNVFFDRGAILTDRKSKLTYLRLWSLKIDLPLPKFELMQSTNKGDYIELYREGEKLFYYLTPPKVNQTKILKQDGKIYRITDQESFRIDNDMISWLVDTQDKINKMFTPGGIMDKLIPYLPQILGGMVMIFILWVVLDKIPDVINQLTTLTDAIRELKVANINATGN